MNSSDKLLAWMSGEIKTPPFSLVARIEAVYLLRVLQRGEALGMPESRSMPSIGARCHELRIQDEQLIWRIVYRIETDAILILEVFEKKTQRTPKWVIDACKRRIESYRAAIKKEGKKS